MIQSGILTTIDSTTGQSTGAPVRGAWINFVQNNVTKATVQTNIETGAYSVDVPLGKYTVKIAVGDVTGIQRAGQLFELKTGDKADAFHKWFYGETGSIDDDLLKQFKQISNDINASANRAESAEKGAKQIETNMQNNSIGSPNGKWLKQTASKRDYLSTVGDYFSQGRAVNELKAGDYGLAPLNMFLENNPGLDFSKLSLSLSEFAYYTVDANYGTNQHVITLKGYNKPFLIQSTKRSTSNWSSPIEFFSAGSFGLGGSLNLSGDLFDKEVTGFYRDQNSSRGYPTSSNLNTVIVGYGRTRMNGIAFQAVTNKAWLFNDQTRVFDELYTTANTTVDTNGFIKKASPIIKLFDDHIEWNQDFKEDPIFEKIAPGTYKISNTNGLARNGWTYEKPRGKDGNTYFKIKVQKLDDGCIISVHDYFVDYEDITIIDDVGNKRTIKNQIEVLSQARDIKPEERWIDLRFFEKIYDLTNEPPKINIPYHPLWGIEPYIPPIIEQIEDENIALLDQRAF